MFDAGPTAQAHQAEAKGRDLRAVSTKRTPGKVGGHTELCRELDDCKWKVRLVEILGGDL